MGPCRACRLSPLTPGPRFHRLALPGRLDRRNRRCDQGHRGLRRGRGHALDRNQQGLVGVAAQHLAARRPGFAGPLLPRRGWLGRRWLRLRVARLDGRQQLAQRKVEGQHHAAEEGGDQEQEAARGPYQPGQAPGLQAAHRAAAAIEAEQAEHSGQDQAQAEQPAQRHDLDPGRQEFDARGDRDRDHEGNPQPEAALQSGTQEDHRGAARGKDHSQRDQRGQGQTGDPGQLAPLPTGNLEIGKARRLDPKTLARRRPLDAAEALAARPHDRGRAATMAATNACHCNLAIGRGPAEWLTGCP